MVAVLDRRSGAGPAAALRGSGFWFIALGVALILLGFVALGSLVAASLATAVVMGVLLMFGGGAEVAGAFFARGWGGFFVHLLTGVLSVVVGALFLRAPVGALLVMTLLLACLLFVNGIFRVAIAATHRFTGRGWMLASGVIDVILGFMIWLDWPAAAFWVIGLFVGISLVVRGGNWIALGAALRSLPRPEPGRPGV